MNIYSNEWHMSFQCLISVHPCDREDVNYCDQICTKKDKSYECSCNVDYEFAADEWTCVLSKYCGK